MSREEEPKKEEKKVIVSRSKLTVESGGGDSADGGWLTSYADMMTLIACFFILLTSFANYDPVTFGMKSKMVADHFMGEKKYKEKLDEMSELKEAVQSDQQLSGMSKIEIVNDTLEITFSGSTLFPSGSSELKDAALESLDVMIELIKLNNPEYRIIVEGHTDGSPTRNSARFRSNWDLSGSRAASIVERFEKFSFDPKQLVSIGYGDTKPIFENFDKNGQANLEHMALNRRVVIKVLRPNSQITREKLGLGVYFQDDELIQQKRVESLENKIKADPNSPSEVVPEYRSSDLPHDPLLEGQ
jgi:chemotaxis protein MotB